MIVCLRWSITFWVLVSDNACTIFGTQDLANLGGRISVPIPAEDQDGRLFIRFQPTQAQVFGPSNITLQLATNIPSAANQTMSVTGTGTNRFLTVSRNRIDFPDLTLNTASTEDFDVIYGDQTTLTIQAPANYQISLPNRMGFQTPATQYAVPLAMAEQSGTLRVRVHITPAQNAAFLGLVNVQGVVGSRITVPVNAYLVQCANNPIPKVKTLVVYTPRTARFIREQVRTVNGVEVASPDDCNYTIPRHHGLDIYDYVSKSIDLANKVNYNSGVPFRYTLDPVQLENGDNIFRHPLIVPCDTTIIMRRADGTTETFGPFLNALPDEPNGAGQMGEVNQRGFFGSRNAGPPGNNSWHDRFDALMQNTNSNLRRYMTAMGVDVVVFIAVVNHPQGPVNGPAVQADLGQRIGGKANSFNPGNVANSYLMLNIQLAQVDKLIWAHELGHLLGFGHTDDDIGAYPLSRDLCLNPIGRQWTVNTVMESEIPNIPYWRTPNRFYQIPQTDQVLETWLSPAFFNNNDDESVAATINGQAMAAFSNAPLDAINAIITGPSEMQNSATAAFRVTTCGMTAPIRYQWYVQQDAPGRPTLESGATATTDAHNFTFTAATRQVILKVVIVDGQNRKITAEKVITCVNCQPVAGQGAMLTGGGNFGGEASPAINFDEAFGCGNAENSALTATFKSFSQTTNQSPNQASLLAELHKREQDLSEVPLVQAIESVYPNPASEVV